MLYLFVTVLATVPLLGAEALFPEANTFTFQLLSNRAAVVTKTLRKNSELYLDVAATCTDKTGNDSLVMKWTASGLTCNSLRSTINRIFPDNRRFPNGSPQQKLFYISNNNRTSQQQSRGERFRCAFNEQLRASNTWHAITFGNDLTNTEELFAVDVNGGKVQPGLLRQQNPVAVVPEDGYYTISLLVDDPHAVAQKLQAKLRVWHPHGCLAFHELPLLYWHLGALAACSSLLLASLLTHFARADDYPRVRLALIASTGMCVLYHALAYATFSASNSCRAVPSAALHLARAVVDDLRAAAARLLILLLFGGLGERHFPAVRRALIEPLAVCGLYAATQIARSAADLYLSGGPALDLFLLLSIAAECAVVHQVFRAYRNPRVCRGAGAISNIDVNLRDLVRAVKMAAATGVLIFAAVCCLTLDLCGSGWLASWLLTVLCQALNLVLLVTVAVIYRPAGEARRGGQIFFK